MKSANSAPQLWSTSSFGSAPDTSPMELAALGAHLQRCESQRGLRFGLESMGESIDRFVAPRFMTTLFLVVIVGAVGSMLF